MPAIDEMVGLTGISAAEVCLAIAEMNGVSALGFAAYKPQSSMSREIERAAAKGKAIPLAKRLRHVPLFAPIWLEHDNMTLESIASMIDSLPEGSVLTLVSRVRAFGREEELHIPMMDFDYPAAEKGNSSRIVGFLRSINMSGYLVCSGDHFHFYGDKVVTYRELAEFAGKCLLYDHRTLGRYIGHQLLDGRMNLRISPKPPSRFYPVVVAPV